MPVSASRTQTSSRGLLERRTSTTSVDHLRRPYPDHATANCPRNSASSTRLAVRLRRRRLAASRRRRRRLPAGRPPDRRPTAVRLASHALRCTSAYRGQPALSNPPSLIASFLPDSVRPPDSSSADRTALASDRVRSRSVPARRRFKLAERRRRRHELPERVEKIERVRVRLVNGETQRGREREVQIKLEPC